jgi:hypothetical protein
MAFKNIFHSLGVHEELDPTKPSETSETLFNLAHIFVSKSLRNVSHKVQYSFKELIKKEGF